MPADIIPIKRLPQSDDGVQALLAKLLAVKAQRVSGTALVSATRSLTTQSNNIDCSGFSAMMVTVHVTGAAAAGGLQLRLRTPDPVTSNLVAIWIGTSTINSVTNVCAMFGPGFGTMSSGNVTLGGGGIFLPNLVRIEMFHLSADPYTYSVGYVLIP